ncbi:MAG: UTP--glucose-1-phosphate uridylyltransferase GalU [Bdellovibrionaceae bacterium]|nr:UTP--glucose-1-phosphate uridylyltransferase GalU [Pseudobdellovibrionaceae bacterium]
MIKKAVIPAAGLGTRFLPATKNTPKELLPIIDKPIILYVVEEAIKAGIEDIIFISGRGKHNIEDFFDISVELELHLKQKNQLDLLERIENVRNLANIISVRQKKALGLGHAVLCAKPVVGKEPFAVLLGDEISIAKDEQSNTALESLVEGYNKTEQSITSIMKVEKSEVSKYGIVALEKTEDESLFKITDVVEKPSLQNAPSQYALPGRYIFKPSVFQFLENLKPGKNNEIQLTDAMTLEAKKNGLLGATFDAKRFDAGDKLGYLMANIELGLQRPELHEGLKKFLIETVNKIN